MAKLTYSQTWSSLLNYIKRELGANVQLLEMTDDELVEGLHEDCLSLFSQYSPHKDYCFITETNYINVINPGEHRYKYLMPIPQDKTVIDILEVIPNTISSAIDGLEIADSTVNGLGLTDVGVSVNDNIIDLVISNSYTDAARSLGVRNTWEFSPPNIILMDQKLNRASIIYNTPHETPKTIRPDLYNTTFKPLCLGHVERWIAAKRAKFENVSTPFGQINLNWNKLETDSQTHIQDAMARLELVPPDKLIEVC